MILSRFSTKGILDLTESSNESLTLVKLGTTAPNALMFKPGDPRLQDISPNKSSFNTTNLSSSRITDVDKKTTLEV